MRKIVCFLLLLALFSAPVCLAHGGKTDLFGGHTDRSTGEYHYHHGYPAHSHSGGVCPYEFKDQTGVNSGSSSSSPGTTVYYRTTGAVNMRSSASTSGTILRTIPANTTVRFMGAYSGNWIKVYYDTVSGWCHENYLVKVPKAVVTAKPTVRPTVKPTIAPTPKPVKFSEKELLPMTIGTILTFIAFGIILGFVPVYLRCHQLSLRIEKLQRDNQLQINIAFQRGMTAAETEMREREANVRRREIQLHSEEARKRYDSGIKINQRH